MTESARELSDETVDELQLDCEQLTIELTAGAHAVLKRPHSRKTTLRVVAAGSATLRLTDADVQELHVITEGPVSIVLERGSIEDLTVDFDRRASGPLLIAEHTTIAGLKARSGDLGELRAVDAHLSNGVVEMGRLTLEASYLEQMRLVSDDALLVDIGISETRMQLRRGAIYTGELFATDLVGCDEFLIHGSRIEQGVIEGCTETALRLVEVNALGDRDGGPMAHMIGPIVASQSQFQQVLFSGAGGARGITLREGSVETSVFCEPSVLNAEAFSFSCSSCPQNAAFPLCSRERQSLDFFDNDCAPFYSAECEQPRAILPTPPGPGPL